MCASAGSGTATPSGWCVADVDSSSSDMPLRLEPAVLDRFACMAAAIGALTHGVDGLCVVLQLAGQARWGRISGASLLTTGRFVGHAERAQHCISGERVVQSFAASRCADVGARCAAGDASPGPAVPGGAASCGWGLAAPPGAFVRMGCCQACLTCTGGGRVRGERGFELPQRRRALARSNVHWRRALHRGDPWLPLCLP